MPINIPLLAPGYYAVFLDRLRMSVKLGVLPEENIPQPIEISIVALVERLGPGDGIEDVVDYNHLREVARAVTQDQHLGLQETLCEAIIAGLRHHRGVAGVIVESRKVAAYSDAEAVGCQMADIAPGVFA